MMQKHMGLVFVMSMFLSVALFVPFPGNSFAGEAGTAARTLLPEPDKKGGVPLMQALELRGSNRSFSPSPLPEQDLANMLWAAWGFNRGNSDRRTIPTAMNKQDVELYAVLESGVWRYNARDNQLEKQLDGDMRSLYGDAPLTLLYAVPKSNDLAPMHAGAMFQNVGLYCASAGLANVVKRQGYDALDGKLELPPGYQVLIVQSVGLPR